MRTIPYLTKHNTTTVLNCNFGILLLVIILIMLISLPLLDSVLLQCIEALYVSGLQDNDCVLRIFASFNILVRISSSPPTRSKHKYPSKRADSE